MICQDDRVTERDELIDRLRLLGEVDATQTALFQQAAAERYGLAVTDMKALSIVLREGPQSAGALVTRLAITSGAVTGVIDRLVRAGLVRREADAADRRKVIVSVDLPGLARRENVYLPIGRAFEELYSTYSVDELNFLTRHLERSIEFTRAETQALADADERTD